MGNSNPWISGVLDTSYVAKWGHHIKKREDGFTFVLIPPVFNEMHKYNHEMLRDSKTGKIGITQECIRYIKGITQHPQFKPTKQHKNVLERVKPLITGPKTLGPVDENVLLYGIAHATDPEKTAVVLTRDCGILDATEHLQDYGYGIYGFNEHPDELCHFLESLKE